MMISVTCKKKEWELKFELVVTTSNKQEITFLNITFLNTISQYGLLSIVERRSIWILNIFVSNLIQNLKRSLKSKKLESVFVIQNSSSFRAH